MIGRLWHFVCADRCPHTKSQPTLAAQFKSRAQSYATQGVSAPIGVGRQGALRSPLNPMQLTGLAECSTPRPPRYTWERNPVHR